MKNIIQLVCTVLIISNASLLSKAQCPAEPACTQTATSGLNYSVLSGTVLCINSNYNSGTLTVAGGTIVIQSGGTLNSGASVAMTSGTISISSGGTLTKDITSTSGSIINNCGTISGTRNFNSNVTLNNYSTSAIALKYGGNVVNNFSNNATISFGTVDVTGGILNNFATGLNFSITGSWNNGVTFNNAANASMNVTSVPGGAMPSSAVFNNAGSLTYSPVLNTTGATFTNAATGTLNFSSSASANKPNITNNGTMNVSGTFYLAGNTTTNNGTMNFSAELRLDGGTLNMGPNSITTTNTLYKNNGTINMSDQSVLNIVQNITTWNGTPINLTSGCAAIYGSSTPSTTNINSNVLSSPNLNFCGSAPMQAGGTFNTISAVVDNGSGAYRITMVSGPATNGYVQISGVTGVSNLNGYWQVIRINATTFDLVGSTYGGGAVLGSSQVQVDQSKLKLGTSTYLGYSGCTNPCAPLPVKILSFSASKDSDHVKISWQTIEEKNHQSYSIQRASDAIHFQSIEVIQGNRSSSSIQLYTIYDFNPLEGTSYYRLKQIDYDGTIAFSSIATVTFDKETEWKIFPNPSVDGSFTIQSDFDEADVIAVTITDVSGNNVRLLNAEAYNKTMEVNGLSSGLYIVSIQSTSAFIAKKLVVK